jgi:NAD(P)-dependent dehydrogenase (short-subunit alcohol dehydrogenase family)
MPSPLFDLTGKAALITGGSKGIGKAIAIGFAQAGADVMICSRHEDELQSAAEEIKAESSGRVETLVTDMTNREHVEKLAAETNARLGKVDILINNAGSNTPQPTDQIDDAVWDRLIELNLTSCLLLTRAVLPGMKERGWGRIIYTASIMGITGSADRSAYCATKGALISMGHSQAVELGQYGITVNCISPGPIATDLPMSLLDKPTQDRFASRTALGRWGQPAELAGPALLLASEAGSYITGENLVVDGGCTIKSF